MIQINPLPKPRILSPEAFEEQGSAWYYLADKRLPLVQVEICFNYGTSYEEKALYNSFAWNLLFSGTKTKSQSEILEAFDALGVHHQVELEGRNSGLSISCLQENLSEALKLTQDLLNETFIPEKEFNNYKNRRKQSFLIESEKNMILAKREFNAAFYGKAHPLGHYTTLADFDAVELDNLRTHLRDKVFPAGLKIYVAGDLSEENKTALSQFVKAYPVQKKYKLKSFQYSPSEIHVEKEEALQSAIKLGGFFPKAGEQDYFPLKVLVCLLGGYFGSRLNQNLREQKGLTYGINAYLSSNVQCGVFGVVTEVNKDKRELALENILHEFEQLKQEKVDDKELQKVKSYMKGQLLQATDGVFSQIDLLKISKQLGLHSTYYADFIDAIDKTDENHLLQLAHKYLNYNELVKVSVG